MKDVIVWKHLPPLCNTDDRCCCPHVVACMKNCQDVHTLCFCSPSSPQASLSVVGPQRHRTHPDGEQQRQLSAGAQEHPRAATGRQAAARQGGRRPPGEGGGGGEGGERPSAQVQQTQSTLMVRVVEGFTSFPPAATEWNQSADYYIDCLLTGVFVIPVCKILAINNDILQTALMLFLCFSDVLLDFVPVVLSVQSHQTLRTLGDYY